LLRSRHHSIELATRKRFWSLGQKLDLSNLVRAVVFLPQPKSNLRLKCKELAKCHGCGSSRRIDRDILDISQLLLSIKGKTICCSPPWNFTLDQKVQRLELTEVADRGGDIRFDEFVGRLGSPLLRLEGTEPIPRFIQVYMQH
jgi:hypothetical protein